MHMKKKRMKLSFIIISMNRAKVCTNKKKNLNGRVQCMKHSQRIAISIFEHCSRKKTHTNGNQIHTNFLTAHVLK